MIGIGPGHGGVFEELGCEDSWDIWLVGRVNDVDRIDEIMTEKPYVIPPFFLLVIRIYFRLSEI